MRFSFFRGPAIFGSFQLAPALMRRLGSKKFKALESSVADRRDLTARVALELGIAESALLQELSEAYNCIYLSELPDLEPQAIPEGQRFLDLVNGGASLICNDHTATAVICSLPELLEVQPLGAQLSQLRLPLALAPWSAIRDSLLRCDERWARGADKGSNQRVSSLSFSSTADLDAASNLIIAVVRQGMALAVKSSLIDLERRSISWLLSDGVSGEQSIAAGQSVALRRALPLIDQIEIADGDRVISSAPIQGVGNDRYLLQIPALRGAGSGTQLRVSLLWSETEGRIDSAEALPVGGPGIKQTPNTATELEIGPLTYKFRSFQ